MFRFFNQPERQKANRSKLNATLSWWAFWLNNGNHQEQEEGQGLVEYALVLLLVAIVVIAILTLLGPQIGSLFSAVSKGIS